MQMRSLNLHEANTKDGAAVNVPSFIAHHRHRAAGVCAIKPIRHFELQGQSRLFRFLGVVVRSVQAIISLHG